MVLRSKLGTILARFRGNKMMVEVEEGTRILVVDDDRETRLLLRRALERDGHVVDEAEDSEAALRVFTQTAPDVVLLDGSVPGAGRVRPLRGTPNEAVSRQDAHPDGDKP